MDGHLLLRADAGPRIGAGHVMRCLALAQAWQDAGGRAAILTAPGSTALQTRLSAEGLRVVPLSADPGSPDDALETIELARRLESDWIAADGYHFDAAYQRTLRDAGRRLLFIDDYGHAGAYCADFVLNMNLQAADRLYSDRPDTTQLLLGVRYVLLRREFSHRRVAPRTIPKTARNILVTLGGGDPENVTLRVVQALCDLGADDLEVRVVIGGCNPHERALENVVQNSPIPMRLECNVTGISELMAWADIAISAGGGTCWELAFLGLPACAVSLAENQEPNLSGLAQAGCLIDLGRAQELTADALSRAVSGLRSDPRRRRQMSEQGRKLIDGQGAARVVMHILGHGMRLRPARKEDVRLLWEWANDAAVREASFTSEPIPWQRHEQWFDQKLSDPGCLIFIGVDDRDRPVGQVRLDETVAGEAEIDVSIEPSRRGKGYGSRLISLVLQEMERVSQIRTFHAWVKPQNSRSGRAFENAGFVQAGCADRDGCTALRYIRKLAP